MVEKLRRRGGILASPFLDEGEVWEMSEMPEMPDGTKRVWGWDSLSDLEKTSRILDYEGRFEVLKQFDKVVPQDGHPIEEKNLIGESAITAVPYILQQLPDICRFYLRVYVKNGSSEYVDSGKNLERTISTVWPLAFSRSFWEGQLQSLDQYLIEGELEPDKDEADYIEAPWWDLPWEEEIKSLTAEEREEREATRSHSNGPAPGCNRDFSELSEELFGEEGENPFERLDEEWDEKITEDEAGGNRDDMYFGLCSKVMTGDSREMHLPLMDIKVENSPQALENLRRLLRELGETHGIIIDSGRSFHYWGLQLLTHEQWKDWMRRWYFSLGDNWFIAFSLLNRGYSTLRLTQGFYKPYQPKVIEIFKG